MIERIFSDDHRAKVVVRDGLQGARTAADGESVTKSREVGVGVQLND